VQISFKNTLRSVQQSIPEARSHEEEDELDNQSTLGKTRFFRRSMKRSIIQKSEQNLVIPGLQDHVEASRNRKQSEGLNGFHFRFRAQQNLGVNPKRNVSRSTIALQN
jgi:hypothetical protein